MYECYECGVDRGGSGMREDGNCIDCGPVTKKKLKRRVEELIEAHDRLAAENAELRRSERRLMDHQERIGAALAAANATLDALREVVPDVLPPHMSWKDALDGARAILYPQPAALAEEKKNGN